jgi:hypothetical protein
MILERLTIDERYCGPPDVANGGYVAGLLARHVDGAAEVTLRAPAPLGRELKIERREPESVGLFDGDALLASARPAVLELDVPRPPDFATAEKTAGSCRAMQTHPFPRDFVCGPGRAPGDGLRVFPGTLPGTTTVAAAWMPDASLADASGHVRPEFLWAVLDSPSSFPLLEDPEARRLEPMVLGRLAVAVHGAIEVGERCVVIAWPLALEGRRGFAATALFAESGDLVALGRATWISLAGR